MILSSAMPNRRQHVLLGSERHIATEEKTSSAQLSLVLPHLEDCITSLQNTIANDKKSELQKRNNPFVLTEKQNVLFSRLIASRDEPLPDHIVTVWRLLIPVLIELSHHILNPELTLTGNLRMARQIFIDSKRDNDFSPYQDVFNNNVMESVAVMVGVTPHNDSETLLEGLARGGKGSFQNTQNAYARSESMLCMELILTHLWYKRNREHASNDRLFVYAFVALSHLYWDCSHSKVLGHLVLEGVNASALIEEGRANYYEVFTASHVPNFLRYVTENLTAMRHVRLLCAKRYNAFLKRDMRWGISHEDQLRIVTGRYVRENNQD